MSKNVLSLFPSSVSFYVIDSNKTEKIKTEEFEFIETSAEDGSSVTLSVEVLKKYPKLKKSIMDNFIDFSTKHLHYDQKFRLTTSWITKVCPAVTTNFHNHKNCFYSGVYYFDEYVDGSGKLEFKNPLADLSSFHILPNKYDLHSAFSWSIPPQKNLLVFFPSYLYHRVTKHQGKQNRFSIAFNIVPEGSFGSRDSFYLI